MQPVVPGLRRILAHPVLRNAAALSWVQLATFLVPLVTLPYLARTLGPSAFGLVVLGQGLSFLVTLVVDFGFQLSAAREVAARRDRDHHAAVLARVLAAKLALAAVAAAGTVVAWAALPQLRAHPEVAVLAWAAGLAQALGPVFFFLGVERMARVAGVTLAGRIVAAALTFVVVRDAGDVAPYLALLAATALATSAAVLLLAHREVPWRAPDWRAARRTVREARTLFAMQGTLSLYTTANVVLLGVVATAAQVAHFGAAEKLVRAGTSLLGTVMTAAFPRLSAQVAEGREADARRLAARLSVAAGGLGVLVAAGLAVAATPVVRVVFGPGYGEAADVLRVLGLIVPLLAVTGILGGGLLLALRRDATVLRIALAAGVTNVVAGLALASAFGPVGMAVSVVLAEVVALGGCVLALRRPGPARAQAAVSSAS